MLRRAQGAATTAAKGVNYFLAILRVFQVSRFPASRFLGSRRSPPAHDSGAVLVDGIGSRGISAVPPNTRPVADPVAAEHGHHLQRRRWWPR